MNQELAKIKQQQAATAYLYGYPDLMPEEEKVDRGLKVGALKITGETQLSFGITPHDFIWKRANFDLNERFKSWRMTSDAAYNRRFNTYDPRIYDSLDINLDTENKEGFNFHTDITIDPWSFVGKSDKKTITAGGDTAEIQLLYWSNTGYVVNHTTYTTLKGDTIDIPELKVEDGKTDPTSVKSKRNAATFNIPAMKIKREFQPVRELWLDYNTEPVMIHSAVLLFTVSPPSVSTLSIHREKIYMRYEWVDFLDKGCYD